VSARQTRDRGLLNWICRSMRSGVDVLLLVAVLVADM
jgi:hypothetical protein